MTGSFSSIRGNASLLAILTIALFAVAGGYFYLNSKADARAKESLDQLVEEAREEGVDITYDNVDASPLSRSVTIEKLSINAGEQEPDILLGKLRISGFDLQDLDDSQDSKLPEKMCFDIKDASVHIKPSMIAGDRDLQTFVDIFGDKIDFSSQFSYELDEKDGILSISSQQTFVDNFVFDSDFAFGSVAWLADLDANADDQSFEKLMDSTLNTLSITFENDGFIEKAHSTAAKQTGKTEQQISAEATEQLKGLRMVAENNWGSVFLPMIDELIAFSQNPEKLHLTIDPDKPIDANDFLLIMMGGDSAFIEVIKKANISVTAN